MTRTMRENRESQYPTDKEKNICEAAVLQIWKQRICIFLIIPIILLLNIVSYIIVLEILPFRCEELQDAISSTLHKELMPTHRRMTLEVAIWFLSNNAFMPIA